MFTYRLYRLDEDGHIIGAEVLEAPADADAYELAERRPLPFGGELWQDGRRVGEVAGAPG